MVFAIRTRRNLPPYRKAHFATKWRAVRLVDRISDPPLPINLYQIDLGKLAVAVTPRALKTLALVLGIPLGALTTSCVLEVGQSHHPFCHQPFFRYTGEAPHFSVSRLQSSS